jgi:hypothetical protein
MVQRWVVAGCGEQFRIPNRCFGETREEYCFGLSKGSFAALRQCFVASMYGFAAVY